MIYIKYVHVTYILHAYCKGKKNKQGRTIHRFGVFFFFFFFFLRKKNILVGFGWIAVQKKKRKKETGFQ